MAEVVEVLKIEDVNVVMLEDIDVTTNIVDDTLLLACIGMTKVLTINTVIEGVKDIKLFSGVIDMLDIGVIDVEIMDDEFEDTSISEVDRMILDIAYLELEKITLLVAVKMDDITIDVVTLDMIEREVCTVDGTREVLKKDDIIL